MYVAACAPRSERIRGARSRRFRWLALALAMTAIGAVRGTADDDRSARTANGIYGKQNLAAWCIVPFDAKNRSPRERAEMLEGLGIQRFAYDWRDSHIAQLEEEIVECKRRNIEFFAFWGWHDSLAPLIAKHDVHPQIWLMVSPPPGATDAERVENAANGLLAMAEKTKLLGLQLGLYNHGDWGGEPANMAAVCRRLHELGHNHVGIVYNFHHGHGHIDDFPAALETMLPYLICVNLNGMNDNEAPKILQLGAGKNELRMMKTLQDSGYQGPIGLIHHRDGVDAITGLQENIAGMKQILTDLGDASALATYRE